jgi:hypothetical protein
LEGRPCNRRAGKLYLPPGGRYFGCRQCYRLTYISCQTHDKRVDALLKNPALLEAAANSRPLNFTLMGLVLAACAKERRDLEKRKRRHLPQPVAGTEVWRP